MDFVFHSDALYSAVTLAMQSLGWLEEWLGATAKAEGAPAVCFSSLFPAIGDTRLISPPRTSWPPSGSSRLTLSDVRLVPLDVARRGIVSEAQWAVDGATGCLLPAGMTAPFVISLRGAAAVDRMTGNVEPHKSACLEFGPSAGWWGVMQVNDAEWEPRVKAALRLLADSGFGGERSRGWGRAAEPEFRDASGLFPVSQGGGGQEGVWWLLSLYSPHESDSVNWDAGDYAAVARGGWAKDRAKKKQVRMLEEGSVLFAPSLRGRAVDVAPDNFAHPVYRAGFALAVPVPAETQA